MARTPGHRPPPLKLVTAPPRPSCIFQPLQLAAQRLLQHSANKPKQTKSPIARIPTEILQTVFGMATEVSGDDIVLAEKRLAQATILSCSQICRYWRAAARGYSSLWIHAMDFQRQSVDVILELLRLSNPHQIDVGHRAAPFLIHRAKDVFVLNILEKHVDRIREWNVEFTGRKATQCWVFDSKSSSKLHTFRWTGPFTSYGDLLHGLALPNSFPCRLCLRDTNFPISPMMNLAHLTELAVSNVLLSKRLPVADWLAILHRTPCLQFLSLHNAIGRGGRQVSSSAPWVKLPCLRLISLEDGQHVSPMMATFLLLKPSPFCGVEINLPPSATMPSSPLMAFLYRIVDRYLQDYLIDGTSIPCLEMAIQPHSLGPKAVLGTVPQPEINLNWNGPGGTEHVMKYLQNASFPSPFPAFSLGIQEPNEMQFSVAGLMSSFLLSGTQMRITIDDPFAAASLYPHLFRTSIPSILLEMGYLKTLYLDEGAIISILPEIMGQMLMPGYQPLMNLFDYTSHFASPFPVLPRLKTVVTERVGTGVDRAAFQMLRDFVKWRAAVGYPVQVLNRNWNDQS